MYSKWICDKNIPTFAQTPKHTHTIMLLEKKKWVDGGAVGQYQLVKS